LINFKYIYNYENIRLQTYIFITFINVFFITSTFSFEAKNNTLLVDITHQDKSFLIKKNKARITTLNSQREDLKKLKKWSDKREKSYQKEIEKLKKSLLKLGFKEEKKYTKEEKIK
jgi:hypothetical protein